MNTERLPPAMRAMRLLKPGAPSLTALYRVLSLLLFASFVTAPVSAQKLKDILNRTPDTQKGAELFRHCIACHGADGLGAPDGSVPMIAAQHPQVIAKQLIDYRRAKRWDPRMERVAELHVLQKPQDIADVAGFASALERKKTGGVGDGAYSERGAQVYAQRCSACHGAQGEGNAGKLIPRLAGQHYDYLLRQLYDAVDDRRPNLSRAHVRLLKVFVMEDFEGVADHLSRLDGRSP